MYKGLLTKFTGFITYKTCELDKQNQHQNLVCQVWSKKILNSTLISCCSALSLVSRHCPLQSCCESPPYSPPPVNNAFMFRFSARGALKCFNWRHLDDISPPSALLLPQLEKIFQAKAEVFTYIYMASTKGHEMPGTKLASAGHKAVFLHSQFDFQWANEVKLKESWGLTRPRWYKAIIWANVSEQLGQWLHWANSVAKTTDCTAHYRVTTGQWGAPYIYLQIDQLL